METSGPRQVGPQLSNASKPAFLKDALENGLPSDKRFWKAMTVEDDLGAVMRTQTFLESYVKKLVYRHFSRAKAMEPQRNASPVIWLCLAAALGELKPEHVSPISKLASLRNKFAHDPETELSEKDMTDFKNCFTGAVRDRYQRNFDISFPAGVDVPEYNKLTVPQREFRAALVALKETVEELVTPPKPATSEIT
jgi:hypothetical protein